MSLGLSMGMARGGGRGGFAGRGRGPGRLALGATAGFTMDDDDETDRGRS